MEQVKKPVPEDKVVHNVLDYTWAADYIDTVLGYEQRHAHTAFPEQGSYLNYWHYVMDRQFSNGFTNDSYVRYGPYSFVEFHEDILKEFGEDDWRVHIAKVWADEFPDSYQIWMSW